MRLPVDDVVPELLAALRAEGRAVLQAPPGAGKTTRVPLALDKAGLVSGKIVMLEPRRIAARAAAERLAEGLGEEPGGAVGYRMRGASVPGRRIEVVTEGILTRMIQSDPELSGIGMLIFDEFHERSLNADLGLALTLDLRAALRPDLHLLVMSATLDAGPVAALIGEAPVVTSQGRAFPVESQWLPRPLPAGQRFEPALATLILNALHESEGGLLAFLPGEGEIRRVAALLAPDLPRDCHLRPLYGALPFSEQRRAILPEASGRKVVLATAIAETSLTIEDVRIVVDGGRARRAQFDPGRGMSRLVTTKVTRAEAVQRAGRAGRVAPGRAYKLWARAEEGALAAYPDPEILQADLAGLALDLANWGASDLPFLTPPPEAALSEARALLQRLGALASDGAITAHGRAMAAIPLHPRLAHMLQNAGKDAANLAAVLSERDILRGAGVDLGSQVLAVTGRYEGPGQVHRQGLERVRREAKRLARFAPAGRGLTVGQMAALAYPDRIGLRRAGDAPRYLLSGGRGAEMPAGDPLGAARLIVATDLDGAGRDARIRAALALSEADLREVAAESIAWHDVCRWSGREKRVLARREERLGALILDHRRGAPSPEAQAQAMLDGVRDLGLGFSPAAERFRARVALARAAGRDLPDMGDGALMATLEDWLLPYLDGVNDAASWKRLDLLPALRAMLTWEQGQVLDASVPGAFETPLGRRVAIDYSGDEPEVALRLQEVFGVTQHPVVGGRPLRMVLLSPAQRPVQVTMDLPGFWENSYADVRKEMRGRYPKHPWPEDPRAADPTLRAKRPRRD